MFNLGKLKNMLTNVEKRNWNKYSIKIFLFYWFYFDYYDNYAKNILFSFY